MKFTTPKTLSAAAFLTVGLFFAGCIVSDQMTTITIHPEGAADVILLQSNVHSSETGDKANEELRRYVEEFNARKDTDQLRITESGGEIRESRFLRTEVPYSTLIVARMPTAAALEKSFTFKDDQGQTLVEAHFTKNGQRRKFSLLVTMPQDQVENVALEKSIQELRTSQANGLSEMRFAVVDGKITDGRGFTVAEDKQSALLEPKAIMEQLRSQRQVEAFLEWEVAGK